MRLLLLLTNLLLWEHVSSKTNLLSTEDLYHHVVEQAHTNYDKSADIYHEFNVKFSKASWLQDSMPRVCHTVSMGTPDSIKQLQETKTEDILKAVIVILRAWDYPLIHLVLATTALPTASASNNMLQRINDMKNGIIGFLEGLEIILSGIRCLFTFHGLFNT